MLIVADFSQLYTVHGVATGRIVHTYGTGGHNGYAMALIGAFSLFLAFGVWTVGSRPALLAIGLLAVVALLIALLGDLPDAHGSGLLVLPGGRYAEIVGRPSAGFYMETLGGAALLVASVGGFILAGPPMPVPSRRRRAPRR